MAWVHRKPMQTGRSESSLAKHIIEHVSWWYKYITAHKKHMYKVCKRPIAVFRDLQRLWSYCTESLTDPNILLLVIRFFPFEKSALILSWNETILVWREGKSVSAEIMKLRRFFHVRITGKKRSWKEINAVPMPHTLCFVFFKCYKVICRCLQRTHSCCKWHVKTLFILHGSTGWIEYSLIDHVQFSFYITLTSICNEQPLNLHFVNGIVGFAV